MLRCEYNSVPAWSGKSHDQCIARWPLVAAKTVELNPGKISCTVAAACVVRLILSPSYIEIRSDISTANLCNLSECERGQKKAKNTI